MTRRAVLNELQRRAEWVLRVYVMPARLTGRPNEPAESELEAVELAQRDVMFQMLPEPIRQGVRSLGVTRWSLET